MPAAPLSPDENERLAALYEYKVIDTAAEEIFDHITYLATKICNTPISLISLVDRDRQWWKSNIGLPGHETPREYAFCSHSILGYELMEVKDASKDDRFFDNPLVTNDPNIRFYAGMPLVNAQGFKLGTLCVIDREPKELTAEQKELLSLLSKIVMTLLESRKIISENLIEHEKFTEALKNSNNKLEKKLNEQKQNTQIIMLFSQMNGMLQSSITNEEAYSVISKFCQKIFPMVSGTVYLTHASRDYLEPIITWKKPHSLDELFIYNDCWALRRGQYYSVNNPINDLICKHFQQSNSNNSNSMSAYMCLPLMAQGEALGLLCLEFNININKENINKEECHRDILSDTQQLFAVRMAEQIALSLANIKLRQTLHYQSMYDPLTGLYNRRYLSEIFKRELPRAIHKHTHLGVIMGDIDHFKRFNDTFGHDAGDFVLQEVAKIFKKQAREHDFSCRLGGEEFILLVRDMNINDTQQYAEAIRHAVSCLELKYAGKELGKITISLGISEFPTQGQTLEELVNAADSALYKAKDTGRNKIVICE